MGKDSRTGKNTTISWPRDKPQDQRKYETWLQKVRDPDTGEFYNQRDNRIISSGPAHRSQCTLVSKLPKFLTYSVFRVTVQV